MKFLTIIASLTGLISAIAVAPRQATNSQVTSTSTVTTTITDTLTTTYPVTTQQTICSVHSQFQSPAASLNSFSCIAGYVYSTSSLYYSEQCSATQSGGSVIRAYVNQPISACASICAALNGLNSAASSCNGFAVATVGAMSQCFLRNGVITNIPGQSSQFAVQLYTTNPCVTTVSSTVTAVVYFTTTSIYEVEYTSTISSSTTSSIASSTTPSTTASTTASTTNSIVSTSSSTTSSSTTSSSTTSSSTTSSSSSSTASSTTSLMISLTTSLKISSTTPSTTPTRVSSTILSTRLSTTSSTTRSTTRSSTRSVASISTTAAAACPATAIPTPTCATSGAGITYLSEPCFPKTKVCYPTNYYAAQDQGQFSVDSDGNIDSQLTAKCQATCNSQSQCQAYVAIENISPNGLATGTCFFYSTQLVSPRQCADSPSRILAHYKQKVCQ